VSSDIEILLSKRRKEGWKMERKKRQKLNPPHNIAE
jgi:hypothetical protein